MGGAYYLGMISATTTNSTITSISPAHSSPTTPVVGGDKDAHGCIGSAGYTWCQLKSKCLRQWEEPCIVNDNQEIEAIKQALIKKNNWAEDMSLEVTINKREGIYVSGGVREKNTETGGGYFFAVQDGNEWVIVADGNGIISCESVDLYPEYPTSLIAKCWDNTSQNLIKR